MDMRVLRRTALRRFAGAAVMLGALFFISAGTLRYWEAWAYLATLFLPMALMVRHLLRHDPALLERRLAMREERAPQGAVQWVGSIVWLAAYVVPGLDRRFGWSSLPWGVVLLGDAAVLCGYLLFVLVMRENSYASRIVRVHEGQRVITTGPYALVRHPLYLAVVVMVAASPLALGSLWALIPAAVMPLVLVPRILDEERLLLAELAGYREYTRRVRYRLVPGLW
jgi:protein-S-isoprenylcysteine O-methyltransferase Ste14